MSRRPLLLAVLLAAFTAPLSAQRTPNPPPRAFVGDQVFACSAAGGSECNAPIPDSTEPVVPLSSTITVPAPVCANARAAGAYAEIIHSSFEDVGIRLRHVATGNEAVVPSGPAPGRTFGEDAWFLFAGAGFATFDGDWTLIATDPYPGDYGALLDWGLVVDCPIPLEVVSESGTQPGVAEPGERIVYRITLRNDTANALATSVANPLPPNTSFVSATQGGALVGGDIRWATVSVPASGSLTLEYTLDMAASFPAGLQSISSRATIANSFPTPNEPTCDPRFAACGPTTLLTTGSLARARKVLQAQSGSVPGVAEPNEVLTYAITLQNPGGSPLTNVLVEDPVPANTSFVAADNGGTLVGGTVRWTGVTVPAAGSIVLTVSFRVNATLPLGTVSVSNQAFVNGVGTCADLSDPAVCDPTTIVTQQDQALALPVPASGVWAAWLLALLLVVAAQRRASRRP